MKLTRVATVVAAATALSACSVGPKERASGDFDYAQMNQPSPLVVPSELDAPTTASDYEVPANKAINGDTGANVNVMSPRLVRPVALGSRVLENEQQTTAYFDVVDGMGRSVVDFVWRAAENVLQRRSIQWQQVDQNTWLSEPITRAMDVDAEDSSFWDFGENSTRRLERSYRFQLTQDPATHGRTTSLTIDLTDVVEKRDGKTLPMTELLQTNTEVKLLNAIISEVNRLQQQGVLAQGNQVVPLTLATNNKQQPALIIGMAFENAWPLAGLALEQIGLMVDDLNRDAGTYFVEYSEPDGGFLFMGGDDYEALDIEEGEYEVRLVEYNDDTSMTVLRDGEVVSEAWLKAIENAFADALQEQNQR